MPLLSRLSAKRALGAIASTLVLLLPLPVAADDLWGMEEQFANRDDVSHQEIVDYIYESVTPDDYQPGDNGVRSLYEAMFEPPAVKIPMRTITEEGTVLSASTLYYSQGALFLLNDETTTYAISRSFATVDGNLYTWRGNDTTGEQLTRFTGDTTSLVDYLIDWSIAMRSTYAAYLRDPERFTVTESEGLVTLTDASNSETDIFTGIRYSPDPFWMSALVAQFPICPSELANPSPQAECDESERELTRLFMEVGYPIPLEEIPAEVRTLPEGITFEPTPTTASTYMGYL